MNDKDRWPLSQDGEDEYRRTLLARATKGDAQAKKELMETYSVRIYSEKEKAGDRFSERRGDLGKSFL